MSMHAQSMMGAAKVAMIGGVTNPECAIEVAGLRKAYGRHEAVRGIDFRVRRGEVFGLLGPNGAGKTTTVEILEGYRERTAGHVAVLGHDPAERASDLRTRVGIVLQSCGIYAHLTVRETVAHWASLYPRPRAVEEVLAVTGLEGGAGRRNRTLLGGQSRRLDFALALVGDPELIFLDEPTTGFDPEARRNAWDTVRSLRGLGKTVLLTTHYLEEAQALADRVAIIKDGAILAEGPPAALRAGDAPYRVTWRVDGSPPEVRRTDDPTALLHELTSAALARGERLEDLSVSRPSLEDVYLELTAGAADADAEADPAGIAP
jgi:ABC-2 type transport system ATP-binding protein